MQVLVPRFILTYCVLAPFAIIINVSQPAFDLGACTDQAFFQSLTKAKKYQKVTQFNGLWHIMKNPVDVTPQPLGIGSTKSLISYWCWLTLL